MGWIHAGLVSAGLLNLKPLVTHRLPLEQAVEAFEIANDITRGMVLLVITLLYCSELLSFSCVGAIKVQILDG
jgi:hypothetical protein